MQDIISALVKKRSNLIASKQKIEDDARSRCRELDAEIENINRALDTINSAAKQYLCKACGGTGEILYTDAAGGRDFKKCTACKGTGICQTK